MQAFERERRTGTIADEALDARPILGLDAHGGVDAEATRALIVQHTGGIELVEDSLTPEVAEDAFLDDGPHLSDAIGRQVMGLVKRELTVVGLAEDGREYARGSEGQLPESVSRVSLPPPSTSQRKRSMLVAQMP